MVALSMLAALRGVSYAQWWAPPPPSTDEADRIAAFRITSLEGLFGTRYWRDTNDVTTRIAPGAEGADTGDRSRLRQTLSNLRTELFVLARGYAYHPKLVALEMGAGPVYDVNGFTTDGNTTTTRDTNYNLLLRGRFLAEKPYRGELSYERTNDSQPVGPAQSLLLQNTRYGGSASVYAPVTPIPFTISANRQELRGTGTEQVVEDRIDDFNVRAEREIAGRGDVHFHYQATRTDSMSGSVGIPIHPSRTDAGRAQLDTHLVFGEAKQYDVFGVLFANTLQTSTGVGSDFDTRQWRATLDFRGRHSETLQSNAQYQYDSTRQSSESGSLTSKVQSVTGGLTYQPTPMTSATLNADAMTTRGTALSSDQATIAGSASHRIALPLGELTGSVRTSFRNRDQRTAGTIGHVLGERVTLADSVFRTLQNSLIAAPSIVVMNVQRSQTYTEGIDYALDVVGVNTRIQRLVGGNIVDGQEVLVDYDFDVGGTYAVNQFDNSADISWRISSIYSLYARWSDSSLRLQSGTPSSPLNPARTVLYGTRADVPLSLLVDATVGGLAEWEDRREVIAPYKRTTFEAYAEVALPWISRSGIHVGGRRQKLEYPLTPEHDVTQTHYDARFWSRLPGDVEVSVGAGWDHDRGSPLVEREYKSLLSRLRWRVRRFTVTAEYARIFEAQGPAERLHSRGQVALRRDF
ncbi:MAG: hypothetical protein ACM3SO_04380 [Betaproteobacteria bacterium]